MTTSEWQRISSMGKHSLWTIPALSRFALALTRIHTAAAGRAYAAYGGVYIVSSLLWLSVVEKTQPDHCDVIGAGVCLVGAAIVLYGSRTPLNKIGTTV